MEKNDTLLAILIIVIVAVILFFTPKETIEYTIKMSFDLLVKYIGIIFDFIDMCMTSLING